jgi:hypothetical protein
MTQSWYAKCTMHYGSMHADAYVMTY